VYVLASEISIGSLSTGSHSMKFINALQLSGLSAYPQQYCNVLVQVWSSSSRSRLASPPSSQSGDVVRLNSAHAVANNLTVVSANPTGWGGHSLSHSAVGDSRITAAGGEQTLFRFLVLEASE
jgi:hypothetical protein